MPDGKAMCTNPISERVMKDMCTVLCGACGAPAAVALSQAGRWPALPPARRLSCEHESAQCSTLPAGACSRGSAPNDVARLFCPATCGLCPAAANATGGGGVAVVAATSRPGTPATCPRCRLCVAGRCRRCKDSAYLLDGRCVAHAGECEAAGHVAVGSAAHGRACVRPGGVCRFDSDHGCRSPQHLGTDCVASRVLRQNSTCLECRPLSWLVDGVCKRKRFCGKGNRFYGNGGRDKCTCNERASGGAAQGVVQTCKRCYLRKGAVPGAAATAVPGAYTSTKGLLAECRSCKAPYLMVGSKCAEPEACPLHMARHVVGSMGGRCEMPFLCEARRRQNGGPCKCPSPRLCKACRWGAGGGGAQCTRCAKGMYLHRGACVGAEACVAHGLVPIQAHHGGGGDCRLRGQGN